MCTRDGGHDAHHEARDSAGILLARWPQIAADPVTSSAQTPEPTDEQRAVAAELLQCERSDDDFPYCDRHGGSWPCVNIDAVARALAAAVQQERDKVLALLAPGDPNARMDAYYYGFEATGVGIVDGILSAVAQAGKSYHGTDMWAETEQWTPVSHEQRIQQAADDAARRIREVSR